MVRSAVIAVVATLVAGAAGQVFAASPTPPGGQRPGPELDMPLEGVITNPDWTLKPNGDDMARYYPRLPQMVALGGRAVLDCSVTATGRVDGCKIDSENPPGLGFGEAARSMAGLFQMRPMTLDGAPVAGARVVIPIRFVGAELPQVAPEPPPTAAPSAHAMELARRLLALSPSTTVSPEAMREVLDKIGDSGSGVEDSEQVRLVVDALKSSFEAASIAYRERMVVLVASNISESDLAQTLAFMESPAGVAWNAFEGRARHAAQSSTLLLWQDMTKGAREKVCKQIACIDPLPYGEALKAMSRKSPETPAGAANPRPSP